MTTTDAHPGLFGAVRRRVRPAAALLAAAAVVACGDVDSTSQSASSTPVAGAGSRAVSVGANTPNPPHTLTLSSTILGETRRIYVQLPEGYARSRARYPVVVVLDGEWLFELARAQVRFSSEFAAMDPSIPRMIVVGIESTDRDRDFTPTGDSGWEHDFQTAGGADEFLGFVAGELLPFVDRSYRTSPGRLIVGWSFGGLLAMYSAVAVPDLFNAHLCISPAIWWDSDLVLERFVDLRFDRPKRMVVTVGTGEEGGMVHTSTMRIMDRFDGDPVDNLDVALIEIEGVGHSWGIPAALDRGLRTLFRDFVMPEEDAATLEAVDAYYHDLSRSWGFDVDPPEAVMFRLASAQEDKEESIAIIDRLLASEPAASMAHFYKGRFQQKLGRCDEAVESYREALAAEQLREAPNGLRLRWYREAIEEISGLGRTPESPDRGV